MVFSKMVSVVIGVQILYNTLPIKIQGSLKIEDNYPQKLKGGRLERPPILFFFLFSPISF